MAISDRIESIEEHLRDDYSVLELAGADLTNVDKNILNLNSRWKERLLYFMNNGTEVVWENWNKVTGEGTSLSLNKTLEAKMEIKIKPSELYQESTTGANLQKFNPRTEKLYNYKCDEKGQVTITGTTNNNAGLGYNFQSTNPMTLEAGTYTLKVIGTIDSNVTIQTMGTPRTLNANQEYQFTLTETINDFYSGSYIRAGAHNSSYYITLAKGTTATTERYTGSQPSPNPDYPQEVHVVSGDNEVEVVGKNLVNIEDFLSKAPSYTKITNDEYSFQTGGTFYAKGLAVKIAPPLSVSYKITNGTGTSFRIRYIWEDGTATSGTNSGSGTTEQTISQTFSAGHGNLVEIRGDWATSGTFTIKDFMVNSGNTAGPYEAYKGQSYPVNLPEGMFLGSIGDYKDTFFKAEEGNPIYDSLDSATKQTLDSNEWYLEKKIGKVVLNGSEDWVLWNINNTNTQRFYVNLSTNGASIDSLCDKLPYEYGYADTEHYYLSSSTNAKFNQPIILINRDRLESIDVNGIKKYIASNNLTIYRVLETPEYISLNDTLQQQLENIYYHTKSYKDQTNLSQQNNDLPSTLNATALEEM